MTEEADLDKKIAKRFLVIEIDDSDGTASCEMDGFSAWELVGLGAWLEMTGRDLLEEDDDA